MGRGRQLRGALTQPSMSTVPSKGGSHHHPGSLCSTYLFICRRPHWPEATRLIGSLWDLKRSIPLASLAGLLVCDWTVLCDFPLLEGRIGQSPRDRSRASRASNSTADGAAQQSLACASQRHTDRRGLGMGGPCTRLCAAAYFVGASVGASSTCRLEGAALSSSGRGTLVVQGSRHIHSCTLRRPGPLIISPRASTGWGHARISKAPPARAVKGFPLQAWQRALKCAWQGAMQYAQQGLHNTPSKSFTMRRARAL